jgi:alkylation response protein AidB-like acyl-CoA dehydrogenase
MRPPAFQPRAEPRLCGSAEWIADVAEGLDTGEIEPSAVLPRLTGAGWAAIGVPAHLGGSGGDIVDAIAAIAEVAQRSLAAAFVLWGHRTYIEYLLQSPNKPLVEELLPGLLTGNVAGATGLSNAMKSLTGLEPLQIAADQQDDTFILNGKMPWVTNLRPEGFHVAAAVEHKDGSALVVTLAHHDTGLVRSPDLSLMGMRSTNTAAITLMDVRVSSHRIIHHDAQAWLPIVRPAFTGLQCGMSIGLARRSISEAHKACGAGRSILAEPLAGLNQRLDKAETKLFEGVRSGIFKANAAPLFELRIALAEIVSTAVSLELQAVGGRAYLAEAGRDFARRWREAAFIPVITPSLVQLKTALQQRRDAAA